MKEGVWMNISGSGRKKRKKKRGGEERVKLSKGMRRKGKRKENRR